MNAVRKEPQAEHFRCVAIGATISRTLCVETWGQRNEVSGCVPCRVCPASVREEVNSGQVLFISMSDLAAGIVPEAVGDAMQTVPGETREKPIKQAVKRTEMHEWRNGQVLDVLRGRPWISARAVAAEILMVTHYTQSILGRLVKAGSVEAQRESVTLRSRGALLLYALPEDAHLAPVDNAAQQAIASIVTYLRRCPQARTGEVSVATRLSPYKATALLRDLVDSEQVVRSGSMRRGWRWSVTGEESKP